MARILRGEIWWADLGRTVGHEQSGLRPVLVLTPSDFNERSGTVIAVALTSRPQAGGYPFSLEIKSEDLPKRSWVKVSQIRTLSVERVRKRLGRVSPEELERVIDGLNEIIRG